MKKILNMGITRQNEEGLNRKIRLSNLIVLFVSMASISYVPLHLHFKLYSLMVVTGSIFLVSFLCFWLQSVKKHTLGFAFLTFSMMLIMSSISMIYGLESNIHFFQLCICLTAIVFFDNNRSLRFLVFTLSLACFFVLLVLLPSQSNLVINTPGLSDVVEIYGYVNYFILFAFTTVFFTSFVTLNSSYQEKILQQNAVLENKNVQITDSLKYAKHIQDAILPPMSMIEAQLEESFIVYKPKDIVAGDFYWMHTLANGQILFAAADSTGHGVPGAMVSVVCTNALNRAVKEFGLSDPGQILDKVRELVSESFSQTSTGSVKDGMDISLSLINKEERIIKWAGANNPLWIIREGNDTLEEIKPDKQSVSVLDNPKPFTTHTVQLKPGDCFYLFTDGYADQFGGSASKKYMQKRVKKLLLSIYKKAMSTQKTLISDNLVHWMGKLEQVDDICFIGVKL